jgi:hypothetical protein
MRFAKSSRILIPTAAVAVACATAAVLANESSGQVAAHQVGPAHAPSDAAIVTDLQTNFAAFRRARTAADGLSASVDQATTPAQQDTGMDLSQSRMVASNGTVTAWVAPSASGLCLILATTNAQGLPGGQVGCTTLAAAASAGMVAASPGELVAVLPDGSGALTVQRADGSSQEMTPNSDGAVALTSTAPISSYSYTTADGAKHNATVASQVSTAATSAAQGP